MCGKVVICVKARRKGILKWTVTESVMGVRNILYNCREPIVCCVW
jgi:hypothetical protein